MCDVSWRHLFLCVSFLLEGAICGIEEEAATDVKTLHALAKLTSATRWVLAPILCDEVCVARSHRCESHLWWSGQPGGERVATRAKEKSNVRRREVRIADVPPPHTNRVACRLWHPWLARLQQAMV